MNTSKNEVLCETAERPCPEGDDNKQENATSDAQSEPEPIKPSALPSPSPSLAVDAYHTLDDDTASYARYIGRTLVLRVGHVTTLISAATAIVKVSLGAWTTLAVYACRHYLLANAVTATITDPIEASERQADHVVTQAKQVGWMIRWNLEATTVGATLVEAPPETAPMDDLYRAPYSQASGVHHTHHYRHSQLDLDFDRRGRRNPLRAGCAGNLSIVDDPPSSYYYPGLTIIFDTVEGQEYPEMADTKPAATMFSKTQIVAIMVKRTQVESRHCSRMDPTIFGDVDLLDRYLLSWGDGTNDNCYFFGNITSTAGVTRSKESRYLASEVVED
ncbi:uncharacterized protein DSM5745_07835 [Aspergillus mulundensis]|uniref:Uncharacterized protein n=1 Tax=Aspergillus mulundensis TaxID=1810919 RepID=A0A3D8RF38_9EURO|nr:hypothetical protein DSM5745_07835 [Aspergillus mulundensis]RDW72663.1 hypothetical protein DSM5745_07835 [Aspergillus mulundensis]